MHDNLMTERGTTVALLEYASALVKLGHQCRITFDETQPGNIPEVVEQASAEFDVVPYSNIDELQKVGADVDVAYFIKSGNRDGRQLFKVPTLIHAVFQTYDPHGDSYYYVSEWLAEEMRKRRYAPRNLVRYRRALRSGCVNAGDFSWIPHAVDMPIGNAGMRDCWGIPADAFVILRYGGFDTFDVPWAQSALLEFLDLHQDVYAVFINTKKFSNHPRALFLERIIGNQQKADALSSADLFLHARRGGESFGLAIVEAQQVDVPVLAWRFGNDRNHNLLIRNKDDLYTDRKFLLRRLFEYRNFYVLGQRPPSTNDSRAFRSEVVVPRLEAALMHLSSNRP